MWAVFQYVPFQEVETSPRIETNWNVRDLLTNDARIIICMHACLYVTFFVQNLKIPLNIQQGFTEVRKSFVLHCLLTKK
jgi:hypothetical protein